MGSQHVYVKPPRRAGFKRLFILSFFGSLIGAFIVTCIVEAGLLIFAALVTRVHSLSTSFEISLLLIGFLLPFVLLFLAALFFGWFMGRRIRQPVDELMLAVDKIRQRDLNFSIQYNGNNELGDLCRAFNELRGELQESLEREWRQQEEMRTMIAALSHDLRTPVTIIQGHVEGLARAGTKREERLERYLPVLESSSQRMVRLLNDILLVASLEQTSFVIRPQAVHLHNELARKAQIYELQAAAHGIEFCYTNSTTTSQEQQLDLHRIEQVLDNLFENALRYTPAGGHMTLTCANNAHSLIIALRDSGPGIVPGDLPHIFEKFYRGDQHRPPGNKSAGLGLYICKLLVEKHGGTIHIRNHPAGGCEACFCLPFSLSPHVMLR